MNITSDTDTKTDALPRGMGGWLALIAGLGLVLRLYRLGRPSFWTDEAITMQLAQFASEPWKLFDDNWSIEAPLMPAMSYVWGGLVNGVLGFPALSWESDFALRLMPTLFSVAAIPVLFAVARRITGNAQAALFAAYLFAISPFHLYYAQELRVYAALTFLALGTTWFLLRLTEERKLWQWIGFVIGCTLMVYAHFTSVLIVLAFNVYILFVLYEDRSLLVPWTVAMLCAIALMIPALMLAWDVNQMIARTESDWYPDPTPKTVLITFKNFFAGYGETVWAYYPLALVGLGFTGFGGYCAWKRYPKVLLAILLTAVPIAANLIIWNIRDFAYYEHRTMIHAGAMLLPLTGMGIAALPVLSWRLGAAGLLTLLTLPMLADHYRQEIHPGEVHRLGVFDKVAYRDAAAWIEEGFEEGDVLIHGGNFTLHAMLYYLPVEQYLVLLEQEHIAGYLSYVPHEEMLRNTDAYPLVIDEAIDGHDRIWYIRGSGITFNPPEYAIQVRDWLDERFEATKREEFSGLTVTLFERGGSAQ